MCIRDRGQLAQGPGGHAPADDILIFQSVEQPFSRAKAQLWPLLRQSAYAPVTGAPQDVVVAKIVVMTKVNNVGNKNAVKILGKGGAGGQNFSKGVDVYKRQKQARGRPFSSGTMRMKGCCPLAGALAAGPLGLLAARPLRAAGFKFLVRRLRETDILFS